MGFRYVASGRFLPFVLLYRGVGMRCRYLRADPRQGCIGVVCRPWTPSSSRPCALPPGRSPRAPNIRIRVVAVLSRQVAKGLDTYPSSRDSSSSYIVGCMMNLRAWPSRIVGGQRLSQYHLSCLYRAARQRSIAVLALS